MQLTKVVLATVLLALGVSCDPILQAPVNTPTLIQTFIVNPRFAPCLQATANYDGAPVTIGNCDTFNGPQRTWVVVKGGAEEGTNDPGPPTQIRIYGDKCLDVRDGRNRNGTKLQIWTCYDGNPNQLWQINGAGDFVWSGHNKCMDLTDGNLNSGTPVQIWKCGTPENPNINQSWNAVPPR
ncbi:hypothetical protein FRB91_009977 [Serendipita sp. 411]|nr:hypothetical protein FRC16_011283 [Serendipita sp. 398]KAG8820551.1 hypothetical protein FRC18_011684 [Serendipita sp. 400]KAG8849392.1 hypothetical protein FRB91_009977 [Serendipita sp. 411]